MNPAQQEHIFGGDWTDIKLDLLSKYLKAYTTALQKLPFTLTYIDAFAGTGYRSTKSQKDNLPFEEDSVVRTKAFIDGSARIALKTAPAFQEFLFIENEKAFQQELSKLKEEFPNKANMIRIISEDCNDYLPKMCHETNWNNRRAVLFLDPYGMQVHWSTMQAIAETQAIDVWILFPLGMAVNRLLRKDGKIQQAWKSRLDTIFGTSDWYQEFYKQNELEGLFGKISTIEKTATIDGIAEYYCKRLKKIFPTVASNPKKLCNTKSSPLFLFCFAAGNPSKKASELALRIAENILGK